MCSPSLFASVRLSISIPLLAVAAAAHGQPSEAYFVDDSAPSGGDGLTWATAFRDLQDALDRTNTPSGRRVVQIAAGLYRPDRGTQNQNATFTLVSGVTLLGGFAGLGGPNPDARDPAQYPSVLSGFLAGGQRSYTVVSVRRAALFVTMDGVTVTGGSAVQPNQTEARGGGFRFLPGSATEGYAKVLIRNCSFVENRATQLGGAIDAAGDLELDRCTFSFNRASAGAGGAIAATAWQARLVVRDCVFEYNESTNSQGANIAGGALFLGGQGSMSVTIDRCVFARNSAWMGGAIGALSGSAPNRVSIRSSLFVANRADFFGGAMCLTHNMDSCDLRNLTCYGNTAPVAPGLRVAARGTTLANSIFWGSPGDLVPQIQVTASYASRITDCDIQNGLAGITGESIPTQNILNVDPLFVNPNGPDGNPATWSDNDARLSPFSPLIDAGPVPTSEFLAVIDLDGNPFKADGNLDGTAKVDIGAYEFRAGTLACPADFNGDHRITPADVADYVRAWLDALASGCP